MMVDALIVAAHSEDSEYFEDKDEVPQVPQQRTQSQVRICEFCGSSNTPTWRRGPGGKGSLCNACGIKWRLRKRTKKGDHPVEKVKSTKAPATKRRRREKDMDETNHMTTLRHPITFKETSNVTTTTTTNNNNNNNTNHITTMNHHHSHPSLSIYLNDEEDRNSDGKKSYYCKFCNKTFNQTHFKNSQQFGAHCSNCSRRPSLQQDGIVPYESDPLSSPSSSSSSSSSSYSPLKRPFHYLSSSSSISPSSSPSPSPSYYEAISNRNPSKRLFAPPPYEDPGYNLLLILRIMQDELADFEEEASRLAAATNSTPSLPSISSLSSHSHSHSHSHPIPTSPYSHSHSHSHSLSSHSLSARPHVMITPTPVL